jgi:serine/threonine protein kinase
VTSEHLERLKTALGGHYQFQRELGEGAFATVFLARDLRLERLVAIKVLHVDTTSELNEIRFLREIRFLASLQHPNIIPVHDSGHVDDLLFYVMPYVRGESLRQRISRERQLVIREAVRITCEVADALDYAHNNGVIHRDVKPENILLSGSHPMLADFGVARAITVARSDKVTGTGLGSPGTPAYMSPEQLLGHGKPDRRTDIYSLGCVLFEMLTGKPPFEGVGGFAMRFTEPAPSALLLRADIPVRLDEALKTALGRSPDERFSSASEMCTAVAQAIDKREPVSGPPIVAPSVEPLATPSALSTDSTLRRRVLVIASSSGRRIALVTLLIAAIAFALPRTFAHGVSKVRPSLVDPRRIAVLAFDDGSPDKSLGHIANGLTVSLTQELSEIPALQVLSRNSVKSLQNRGVPLDSIVSLLQVGSLIEGTVQRSGDRLRLTVQMVNAQSNTQLESASIDRGLGELFLLEDDLAHQVAVILRRRLGVEVRAHTMIAGTKSSRARELVFRADKLRADAERDATYPDNSEMAKADGRLRTADSLLAVAEAADPSWLDPIIERGWVGLMRVEGKTDPLRTTIFNRVLSHANRALARDTASAAALELRGTALYRQAVSADVMTTEFSDRLTRAAIDLNRAIVLDSSLATAWGTLSLVHFARGDLNESARAGRTALAMDTYLQDAPTILKSLYTAYLLNGDMSDAARWCEVGARDYPGDPRFLECKLTLLAEDTAKPPDSHLAWSLVAHADKIDPPAHARSAGRPYLPTYRQMLAAMVLARAGQKDSARSVARRAALSVGSDMGLRIDLLYDEAYLHLLLGERAESLRLLSEYIAARPSLKNLVSKDARWTQIKTDPAFLTITGQA